MYQRAFFFFFIPLCFLAQQRPLLSLQQTKVWTVLETGHILSDLYLILRDQEAPKAQLLVDVTVSDVRGKTLSGRPVPKISWRWRCQNLMSGCQGALLEMCVHRSHDDQLCWHRSWRPSVESEPRWLELFQCVRSCRPYKTHFFKETTGVGHTQDSFMVDIHLTLVLKKTVISYFAELALTDWLFLCDDNYNCDDFPIKLHFSNIVTASYI